MKVYLDDMRPVPDGWVLVKNYRECVDVLINHVDEIEELSLDHDLGACVTCMKGRTAEQWLDESNYQSMPNCEHFGTGYDVVTWMETNDVWPRKKPKVHSANPVGRARMQQVLDKRYG